MLIHDYLYDPITRTEDMKFSEFTKYIKMRDKQLEACAQIFSRFASHVITTRVDWPRAVDETELAAFYPIGAPPVATVEQALLEAQRLAGKDALIVCAGSVYLAGAVLNALGENEFTLSQEGI